MKKLILILILIFSTVSFSEIVNYYNFRWHNADTIFDKRGSSNAIGYGGITINNNGTYIYNTTYNKFVSNPQRILFSNDTPFYHTYSDSFSFLTVSRPGNIANYTGENRNYYNRFSVHYTNTYYYAQFSNSSTVNDSCNNAVILLNSSKEKTISMQVADARKFKDLNININTYSTNSPQMYNNNIFSNTLSVNAGNYTSGGFYETGSKACYGATYYSSNNYYYNSLGYVYYLIHFNHVLRPSEASNYNTYFKGGFQ